MKGVMLGAGINQSLGSASVAGGVRFWSDYVGADLNLGAEHIAIDSSGVDVIKTTDLTVGAGVLVGFPIGRVKPHIRLGFAYSYVNDTVSNTKTNLYEIDPSVGVDFMATRHLMFGMDIFSFPFLSW